MKQAHFFERRRFHTLKVSSKISGSKICRRRCIMFTESCNDLKTCASNKIRKLGSVSISSEILKTFALQAKKVLVDTSVFITSKKKRADLKAYEPQDK